MHMCIHSNIQIFKSFNIQIFKYSNTQIYKYSNIQIFKYTYRRSWMHPCACRAGSGHSCIMRGLTKQSTNAHINEHKHIHTQAHHFSSIGFVLSIYTKKSWGPARTSYWKTIPQNHLHRNRHRSRWMAHTPSFHLEGPTTKGKMYNP